jgi:prepilin-type N-terminal cleavage/methylation domain-containing protein
MRAKKDSFMVHRKKFKLGFTLIELLIVIAIIGTMSTVVVQGLSVAKARSINAAIQYTLAQLARQAADIDGLIAEGAGSGTGDGDQAQLCTYLFGSQKVEDLIRSAAEKAQKDVIHAYCSRSSQGYKYAFLSPKFNDDMHYYCIDENSAVKEVLATNLSAILNDYSCDSTAPDAPSDTPSEIPSESPSDAPSETPSDTPSDTSSSEPPPAIPLAITNASVSVSDLSVLVVTFNQPMQGTINSTDFYPRRDGSQAMLGYFDVIDRASYTGSISLGGQNSWGDLCPQYSDEMSYGAYRYVTLNGNLIGQYSQGQAQYSMGATVNCPPVAEANSQCGDGIDNEADGYTDCSDIDCAGSSACQWTGGGTPPPPPEICGDGVDNDANGATDCGDSACLSTSSCGWGGGNPTSEISCSNARDDDNDGYTDCSDSDCSGNWECST